MFGRLRLQLTLWYVAVLAIILLSVGGVVYWLVARSLDDQVDSALKEVNHQTAEVLRVSAATPEGSEQPEGDEGEGEHSGPGGDEADEYGAILTERLLGSGGDVLPVVLDTEGNVIANPRDVNIDELPIDDALAGAGDDGHDQRDATAGESHVRLLTEQVSAPNGELAGYVITLKSLEARDEDLRRLLALLAIGGGIGVALAAAGGVLVAQLAIRPVRRAFERQREFVADASHELRTPLTVVRANAESLMKEAAPAQREALQDVVDETAYMSRLVADLLTLAQADQPRFELSREPVDLFDVVQSVERAARSLATERGVTLETRAEHVPLEADPDRLRELLMVLADNAVRYTPAGGRVSIEGRPAGQRAEIVVEDTGAGIPREHLSRVFDRFYRVDKARSRAEGGLGLGLSIAQEIAKAHGGTIDIESDPGHGTRVRVLLPAAARAARPVTPRPESPETM
jgi:signal transduction histidine kinase